MARASRISPICPSTRSALTTMRRPDTAAAKIPLPRQGDPPLPPRLPKKTLIRVPPVPEGVIAEDPQPFCQLSQIAIAEESDIHATPRAESGSV